MMNINQMFADVECFKTVLTIPCENREGMRSMRADLEKQTRELSDVYVTTSDVYHAIFDSCQLVPHTIDNIRASYEPLWQMAHTYSVYVIAPANMSLSELHLVIGYTHRHKASEEGDGA